MFDNLITRVMPRAIQRDTTKQIDIPSRYLPKVIDALASWQIYQENEMSLWEKAKYYAKLSYIAIQLVPYFITIKTGIMFNDWKTTTAGIVKAVFTVLAIFGISTGQVTESLVLAIGYAIADLLQAIFTGDSKKNA